MAKDFFPLHTDVFNISHKKCKHPKRKVGKGHEQANHKRNTDANEQEQGS